MTEILTHLIIIIFSSFIIVSANPGSSLFSWHPTSMVLAWSLFTEGVILFRKPSPAWRVVIHWVIQGLGMTFALSGFLAIYKNKEESGKGHFLTYHGILGVITLLLLSAQAIGGNFAKYSITLSKIFTFIRPSVIKWGHRSAGSVTLLAISLTVFLALFSSWFEGVTEGSLWIFSSFALAVFLPVFHVLKTTYC